jgi:hypothetical protein
MPVTPEFQRDNLIQVPTASGQGHHINVMIREMGGSIAQRPCVISGMAVLKEIREYRHIAMAHCLA